MAQGYLTPAEVTAELVETGKRKVSLSLGRTILLALMAGIFIGFAGHAATTVAVGDIPWAGIKTCVVALTFTVGLMLVMSSGAELFTGNVLILIPALEKEVTPSALLRNWIVVYIGNFVGSLLLSAMMVWGAGLLTGPVGETAVAIAAGKAELSAGQIFFRGIGANWMVCSAIVMYMASRDFTGRILGIFFPIAAFVIIGFEHSIANMYFLPTGLFTLTLAEHAALAATFGSVLTWPSVLQNILFTTLGNIVGGGLCVALAYWYIYLKKR